MSIPNVQQLDIPPSFDEPITGALIDGSITFYSNLPEQADMAITLPTPAGESPTFYLLRNSGVPFWYIHFHGVNFMTSTNNVEVGFTQTWYTLYRLGVRDVISGAAAGSVHPDMKPGDVVIVDDFFDFSTHRPRSMITEIWEKVPWIGASYVPPLCPELTNLLRKNSADYELGQVFNSATLAQFEGHRFESPAEIQRAKLAGGDVVHHHQASEAIYARELGIHYGAFNYVSNIAAGLAVEWDESWLTEENSEAITKRCTEIMLNTMVEAAKRNVECKVCPVSEDQPVEIKPEDIKMRATFR